MRREEENQEPWHLEQARIRIWALREQAMVQVAKAIRERRWRQATAARHLGVGQPRISDLMRGKSARFTLETLVEMLFALGKPVEMSVLGQPAGTKVYPELSAAEHRDAVDYFSEVIRLESGSYYGYFRRAHAYHQLKEYDLALADYQSVRRLEPKQPTLYSDRVAVLLSAGRHLEAVQACDDLMEEFCELNLYSQRALAWEALDEPENALTDYSTALERQPNSPAPCWSRARLLERLGRLPEALKDYEKIMLLDPGNREAYNQVLRLRKN